MRSEKIIYHEDMRTDFTRFPGINLADSNTKGDTLCWWGSGLPWQILFTNQNSERRSGKQWERSQEHWVSLSFNDKDSQLKSYLVFWVKALCTANSVCLERKEHSHLPLTNKDCYNTDNNQVAHRNKVLYNSVMGNLTSFSYESYNCCHTVCLHDVSCEAWCSGCKYPPSRAQTSTDFYGCHFETT